MDTEWTDADERCQLLLVLHHNGEAPPEDVERAARQLRLKLQELDVDSVKRPVSKGTPGAKGDGAVWNELLVTLGANGALLTALVRVLEAWVKRHPDLPRISVTIDGDQLEIDQASADERQVLVDAFVRKHTQE